MTAVRKKEALLLFLGDVCFFLISLWVMLFLRYQEIPDWSLVYSHFIPFTFLFVVWVVVFFIAGLYEKHTLILRNKIPATILNAQLINSCIAVIFFYLIPYFGITPKTNLFIYLVISFLLILGWRIYGEPLFRSRNKQNAILIGSGEEMKELKQEVNNNPRYDLLFISSIDLNQIDSLDFKSEILDRIYSEQVQVIAADFKNDKVGPVLPNLYNLIFSKIRFIDMYKIYEDIFDRIPLSLVTYSWFLENISTAKNMTYDTVKRATDGLVSCVVGIISLVFYPLIIVAIKLEDRGPVFFKQERMGKNNQVFNIVKFRSMAVHNEEDGIAKDARITRVGSFLRKTRLDEIPQLWNVFRGDLSLIGPRPEIPSLVKLYEKEIPYYNVRHLIKPGLSGWAQLYHKAPPKFSVGYDETRKKLSYDLFYIKNRSIFLDIKIVLKTCKTLLSRTGI